MASIKLNSNKSYHVNFRLLEATQPSTVRIGIGEKPGVSEPPPEPEPTCVTKSVNQFWDFNYNINTAPSSVPETNPLGWSIIGRSGTLFSIRLPASNKWKELFGVAKIPDTIQFGFGGVIPGYKSPTKIYSFLSECKGNFDTPLPGNSKLICSGEFRSQGAKTVVLSTNASNYNNPSVPKWNQEKDFYFNFRLEGPVGDIGVDLDLFISSNGTGLGFDGVPGTPTCTDQPVAQFKDFTPQTIFRGDFYNLKNGEIGSVKVKPSLGNQKSMSFIVANPAPGGEISDWTEAVISECRGSFEIPPGNAGRENRCRVNSQISEITIDTHCGTTPNQFQCILDPNKDYYINFRYKNPNTNQNTCQVATGCSSIVSIGYGP